MKLEVNIDNYKTEEETKESLVDTVSTLLTNTFDSWEENGFLTDTPTVSVNEITDDWKTKYMYLAAELENTKKRSEKLLQETITYNTAKFTKSLISLMDEFELMFEHEEPDDISEGAKLLYNKFKNVLRSFNVYSMDVKSGDTFNEDIHEAVLVNNTDDRVYNNIISSVICQGYKHGDKIIRYPKVVVYKYNEE